MFFLWVIDGIMKILFIRHDKAFSRKTGK